MGLKHCAGVEVEFRMVFQGVKSGRNMVRKPPIVVIEIRNQPTLCAFHSTIPGHTGPMSSPREDFNDVHAEARGDAVLLRRIVDDHDLMGNDGLPEN